MKSQLLRLSPIPLTLLLGWSSKGHRRVTVLGLSLLVILFLLASNLFLRVEFVVTERILYIPRSAVCSQVFEDSHHQTELAKSLHRLQLVLDV